MRPAWAAAVPDDCCAAATCVACSCAGCSDFLRCSAAAKVATAATHHRTRPPSQLYPVLLLRPQPRHRIRGADAVVVAISTVPLDPRRLLADFAVPVHLFAAAHSLAARLGAARSRAVAVDPSTSPIDDAFAARDVYAALESVDRALQSTWLRVSWFIRVHTIRFVNIKNH